MARVLIIDDEEGMRRILRSLLESDGHACTLAATVQQATATLQREVFDVVLTDFKLPDGTGTDVVTVAADADPTLPVVFLSAYATVDLAVSVMRDGAFDFLTKPFDPENVRSVIRRAAERVTLRRENELLREKIRQLESSEEMLGASRAIAIVRDQIARVAPTNATVLVTGETGTGKELAARAVHRLSLRPQGPFVPINCASLPESLLESELFGHEKGAFTGADRARGGLFESADRGTLFLDEAGEMSLALQAKLLRVIADGQIQRVGGRTSKRVDVRLILATHRDLRQRVKEGSFREDLYYRVSVVPIHMPPLRERLEDLPLLTEYFLQVISREMKVPLHSIDPAAMVKLATYSFPGNIRELRNLLERASILARGNDIGPGDLPLSGDIASSDSFRLSPTNFDLRAFIEHTERQLIERALAEAGGVQAEAARRLSISRSDLFYRLKKFGITASAH